MHNSRTQHLSTVAISEAYRPQYHFTPPANWLNDPNGMVYYQGEYHLFYQHYPANTVSGPMHWGHAVSTDLVNWQHLPIAMAPDELGYIFSGSAVIDWNNTAGFGKEAMVAAYTYHDPANSNQSQAIAYSNDKGRTWTKFAGNPVISTPPDMRNFRDPKVMWFDTGNGQGHWVMSLAAGKAVLFYTSPNLIEWEPSGSFGFDHGATAGVWETPDLFELPVDGGPETRWVLAVGIGENGPAGGSGEQYFVGDFDGKVFTSENQKETILWADFGADFYAAQSWSDVPNNRRIWLAWMNNWRYATKIPTSTWRGSMTIPRELSLTQTDDGIRLVQTAVSELTQLRNIQYSWKDLTIDAKPTPLKIIRGDSLEIIAEIEAPNEANNFGIRVRVGEGEVTTVGYVSKSQTLYVDRTHAGQSAFDNNFAGNHVTQLEPVDGVIRLHIFVDRSSIELFANDGLIVFSEKTFPGKESLGVELFAEGTAVTFHSLDIYELKAAKFFTPPKNSKT